MKSTGIVRSIVAFLVAFLVAPVFAVAWGSVVQTQYNLVALANIGADIEPLPIDASLRDLFGGFFLAYGDYIVLPALLSHSPWPNSSAGASCPAGACRCTRWRLASKSWGPSRWSTRCPRSPPDLRLARMGLHVLDGVGGVISDLAFACMTRLAALAHVDDARRSRARPVA